MDESDPDAFRDLHSATDLALHATKTTAQATGRAMASLVVLEHHVWFNLTEIKDTDKAAFFDSSVFTNGLFGPAVDICQAFHCSTEVFAGKASALVKALQLCSCFKLPEKHADSAARETSACDRTAQSTA